MAKRSGDAVYVAGSSLFTLGFGGDVTGWTRAVVVIAGATGLGLFAVVIAYLPVLYQAFNRREVGVLLLDARAGSPPSGPELLHRMGSAGVASSLPELFAEWERWVADVLETHMSYPLLALFRSPHDDTSWVTSLGSVLDAATLIITSVDDEPDERARLLYGTGVHAVEDLFYYFRLTEREALIQRDEFEDVLDDMKGDGFSVRPVDEAFARFTEKRREVRAETGRDRRDAGRATRLCGSGTAPSWERARLIEALRPSRTGTDSGQHRLNVGEHSRREMAARAGVDPDYVDRLVELGILSPGSGDTFSAGDVRRARWVQSFEQAGVPLEGLAAAVRDGTLSFSYLDATAFDRFAGVSTTTFRELSDRTGVPLDLLLVIREAHGFAEPGPEDHVREDELSVVPAHRAPARRRDPAGGDRAIGSERTGTASARSSRSKRIGTGPRSRCRSSKEG